MSHPYNNQGYIPQQYYPPRESFPPVTMSTVEPLPPQITQIPLTQWKGIPRRYRPGGTRIPQDIFLLLYGVLVFFSAFFAFSTVVLMGVILGWDTFPINLLYYFLMIGVVWFLVSRTRLSRPIPWWLGLMAIVWGTTTAVSLPLIVPDSWAEITEKLGLELFSMSMSGAYPEEISKGLGVVVVLMIGRSYCTRPWHGLVIGALVGLGFETYENVVYAINFSIFDVDSDINGATETLIMRLVVGPGLHIIFSSLVGYGIGLALYSAGRSYLWRLGALLMGFCAGFFAHFFWNMDSREADSFLLSLIIRVGVYIAACVFLLFLVVLSYRRAKKEGESATMIINYPTQRYIQRWYSVPSGFTPSSPLATPPREVQISKDGLK